MPIKYSHLLSFFIFLCLLLGLNAQSLYADTNKLALVIGNSEYEYGKPRDNKIINNARRLKNVLEKLCFDVDIKENLDNSAMEDAIYQFADRLDAISDGGIGLFYFAGLGAQENRQHFLLPTNNARIRSPIDLKYKAIPVNRIIEEMTTTKAKSVIILDACYEKPYNLDAQSLCHNLKNRTTLFQHQSNFFIAYPHEDTITGRNIYTDILIQTLTRTIRKRTDMENLFMQVNTAVENESYGYQISWYHRTNLNFRLGGEKCNQNRGGVKPKPMCNCCGWQGCFPCSC